MMASTTWGTSSSIALPCHVRSTAWRRATTSPRAIEVPCEWSTRLTLHCSCTLAACLHALQALNVLPACTSWKPMMALTSSALEECARAQETCGPSYIDRLARVLQGNLEFHQTKCHPEDVPNMRRQCAKAPDQWAQGVASR
jgi:hypothetical protein